MLRYLHIVRPVIVVGVESIDTRKITQYKSQSINPNNNQVLESTYATRQAAEKKCYCYI